MLTNIANFPSLLHPLQTYSVQTFIFLTLFAAIKLFRPICADYGKQSSQQELWLLNEKLKLTRASITLLDSQINYQVSALPGKINQAMEDIISSIQSTNTQYGGVVTAIVAGRLIRILASTIEDTQITTGDVLRTVIGNSLVSASFAASRVARVGTHAHNTYTE